MGLQRIIVRFLIKYQWPKPERKIITFSQTITNYQIRASRKGRLRNNQSELSEIPRYRIRINRGLLYLFHFIWHDYDILKV